MPPRRSLGAALLLLAACGAASSGVACGYHGGPGDGFSAQHPRSIAVAVALRHALDDGVLASPKVLPPFLAFSRASRTLHEVQRVLAADFKQSQAAIGFALLLVEAGLWARYHVDAGQPVLEVDVSGPLPGDDIVITAEPVLRAMLDARYSIDQAIGAGLIVVAPSPAGSGAITSDALRRAFQRGISPGRARCNHGGKPRPAGAPRWSGVRQLARSEAGKKHLALSSTGAPSMLSAPNPIGMPDGSEAAFGKEYLPGDEGPSKELLGAPPRQR